MADRMDKYEPIKVLGEGSFGKVYLMRNRTERKLVCVKIIKVKNIPRKEREACKMEVDLLRRLNHPNIVGYRESFMHQNKESLCIVMQYCDGGDLCDRIKDAKKTLFPEAQVLHWFVQMALGLHYMHEERVLHRDLKTQNIFMLGNGRLVLGDLGISKVLEGTMDFASTCIGTPYYMSPEIFKNKPYNHKSDIWALGCVLYEMSTLNHAFDAQSLNGLATKIIKGRYPPVNTKYSAPLRDLIGAMLSTSPAARPDLHQILTKPFIKRHIKDFFKDVCGTSAHQRSRPVEELSEGTLIVRRAAEGALADHENSGRLRRGGRRESVAGGGEEAVESLRKQLRTLNLEGLMVEAIKSDASGPSGDGGGGKGGAGGAGEGGEKAVVREHVKALKREEERKRAVAGALERLRLEREKRERDAKGIRKRQLERDAARAAGGRMRGAGGRYVPGQRGYRKPSPGRSSGQDEAVLPAANARRPAAADAGAGALAGGGAGGGRRERKQSRVGGGRRGGGERDWFGDGGAPAAREPAGEKARREREAQAEAMRNERRELERAREEGRRRMELDQLREAKVELDRRDEERRRRNQQQGSEDKQQSEDAGEEAKRQQQQQQEHHDAKALDEVLGIPAPSSYVLRGGARAVSESVNPARAEIAESKGDGRRGSVNDGTHAVGSDQTLLVATRQQATLLYNGTLMGNAGGGTIMGNGATIMNGGGGTIMGNGTTIMNGGGGTIMGNGATIMNDNGGTTMGGGGGGGGEGGDCSLGASTAKKKAFPFGGHSPRKTQQPLRAESKSEGNSPLSDDAAQAHQGFGSSSGSGPQGVTARERVLRAKQERSEAKVAERLRQLSESSSEQAALRQQAKNQQRRQYQSTFDHRDADEQDAEEDDDDKSPAESSSSSSSSTEREGDREGGATGEDTSHGNDDAVAEPKTGVGASAVSSGGEVPSGGLMSADELLAKLAEVDHKGDGPRFQVVDSGAEGGGLGAEDDDGGEDVDSDDLLGSSSDDEEEGEGGGLSGLSEDEGWGRAEGEDGNPEVDAAAEDMKARERELQHELLRCTAKCDELRKSLHRTRSFAKQHTPSPLHRKGAPAEASPSSFDSGAPLDANGMASPQRGVLSPHGVPQDDPVVVMRLDEDDDDDDDSEDYEDDEDDEFESEGAESRRKGKSKVGAGIDEEEEEEELAANSAIMSDIIRDATASGGGAEPSEPFLNIPGPVAPVTPLKSRQVSKTPEAGFHSPRDNRPTHKRDGTEDRFAEAARELSDPPSPKGRLSDRISVLRQRCMEGLGEERFTQAHAFLKHLQDAEEMGYEMGGESFEMDPEARLEEILGRERLHFSSLIDQLIFMEDTLLD